MSKTNATQAGRRSTQRAETRAKTGKFRRGRTSFETPGSYFRCDKARTTRLMGLFDRGQLSRHGTAKRKSR
jgi:hypothetical protein